MKSYDETMKYLEEYYEECFQHWTKQKSKVAHVWPLADIENMTGVNEAAKTHFLDKKIQELGL